MLAGKCGQAPFNLAPDTADGDAEDALPALHQVNDFIGRGALVDRGAVAHQGDLRQVLNTALTQVLNGCADLLKGHAGVQKPLDDLQHQNVAETV